MQLLGGGVRLGLPGTVLVELIESRLDHRLVLRRVPGLDQLPPFDQWTNTRRAHTLRAIRHQAAEESQSAIERKFVRSSRMIQKESAPESALKICYHSKELKI